MRARGGAVRQRAAHPSDVERPPGQDVGGKAGVAERHPAEADGGRPAGPDERLAGEDVPDDPRITVRPYAEVSRRDYDRRLAAIDVLALPLEGGTYLTTGLVADAVGAGIPALVSPWPYLAETLGDGGIPYGRTTADLAATIDALDDATLDRAAPRSWPAARRSTGPRSPRPRGRCSTRSPPEAPPAAHA